MSKSLSCYSRLKTDETVKNVQILRNIFAVVTGKGSDLITWEWNPASSLDTLNSSQQKQVQTAIRAVVLLQGRENRDIRGLGRVMLSDTDTVL